MTAQLGRFVIRDIHPWEGPKVFALTGDPVVMRYMGFATHTSVDQATALIERYQNSPTKWQAVCPHTDPTDVLGLVGVEVHGHQAAMSIMFRRTPLARGAGREFSTPFVRWVFTHPTIWRVWAYCHVDNVPVQRLLDRMNATLEGRLRRFEFFPNVGAEPQDVYVYSIVRN